MTLEQLRIFVAIAERQHVTRAAEALHLTQSAVSSALTTLEGRHGVALFDRIGRRIVLNPTGEIFLVEARAVLSRAAAAEAALTDLGDLSLGKLSIHASQTIASYWLPAHLATFHKTYPAIALSVSIGNTAEVAKAVTDDFSELGLVEGEIDVPALSRIVIDYDRLVLIVGREHPWAQESGGRARDLRQSAWVIREAGSGTRSSFEAMLAKLDLALRDLDIAMVLPGNEAVRGAVEAGAGARPSCPAAPSPRMSPAAASSKFPTTFPPGPFTSCATNSGTAAAPPKPSSRRV